jgi:hypothetical protein
MDDERIGYLPEGDGWRAGEFWINGMAFFYRKDGCGMGKYIGNAYWICRGCYRRLGDRYHGGKYSERQTGPQSEPCPACGCREWIRPIDVVKNPAMCCEYQERWGSFPVMEQ